MRQFGIAPVSGRAQAQKDQTTGAHEPFQPLPAPTGAAPYRETLAKLMGLESEPGTLMLHVIGDHGGVKDPNPQLAVAKALVADREARPIKGCYTLGDVVYFNGAENEYPSQFYEPYAHYNVPIFGIPGNHDGDPEEDGETSLKAFMANFCSASPELPPKWAEFGRSTMTQPNCYWTLESDHATIIGLYSNVPSGGEIETDQEEWLAGELEAAAKGKPLVVALHHPPYSVDAHHGGSARMGEVLDAAFTKAGRCPEMVLSGHVHDFQCFTRQFDSRQIVYIVCGNGGYHNLHGLAKDVHPGEEVAPGVVFEYGDSSRFGFGRLTVLSEEGGTDNVLHFEYVPVDAASGQAVTGGYVATADVIA